MRVKVTSTCEMNEASSVAVDLLLRAQEELKSLSNKKFNYWQVSELLAQISFLREELAKIDHNLDDAFNIASGWLEAAVGKAQALERDSDIPTQEEDLVDEKEG